MIRIRNLLNGDIRTKWRRDFYDAGYGPFIPFGALGGGDPSPVINWDFLQSQSLTSFSRTSNATLFDSTGQLTYAANNLLLNSATLSTQTVTTGLQAGVSVILSFSGTGSVAISGGYTGSLAGTGVSDRVSLKFTTTTNSLTFTVTGSVTSAQLEVVTYQTTPSTYTATTSSQYYGPRYPYAYNGTTWDAQGLLAEQAATNVLTYSQTLATDWTDTNITRVSTTRTSPDGTGNALEVSASAGNATIIRNAAVGSSALRVLSVYLKRVTGTGDIQYTLDNGSTWTTQAITSSWLLYSFPATSADQRVGFRIVTSGDAIQIWGTQLEAGSSPTSYIPNLATGTTTRNADSSLAFSAISLPTGLSFSRASNAMQYDAAGRLTYAPHNLCPNSASMTGATNVTVVAIPHILSFTSTGSAGDYIALSGTGSGTLYGNSTSVVGSRVYLAFTPTAGTLTLTPTGTVANVQVEQVTYETVARPYVANSTANAVYGPRYDYDPLTRLPKGLLIEEGRTNICLQSNAFTTTWSSASSTIVTAAIVAPDGTSNSWLLTNNAANYGSVYQSVSTSGSTTYTFAVYAKANAANYITLEARNSGSVYDFKYTLTGSGTATINGSAVGSPTGSITYVGNGWYRCVLTKTVTGTTTFIVGFGDAPVAASSTYIYGASCEAGSFPTSYIPTTSASGIRSADIATLTGTALTTLQGSAFTAVGEGQTTSTTIANYAPILGIDAGAIILGQSTSSNNTAFLNLTTGSITASFGSGNTSSPYRIAVSTSGAASSLVANNGTVAPGAYGVYTRSSGVGLGNWGTSNGLYNGWVRKFAAYNVRLSDAKLQQKSVVGATL